MEEKKELRVEVIEVETITELPDRTMMDTNSILNTVLVILFNLGGGGGGGAGGINVI